MYMEVLVWLSLQESLLSTAPHPTADVGFDCNQLILLAHIQDETPDQL